MNYITISPQRARVLCDTHSVKSGNVTLLTNTAQLQYVAGEYRIYSADDAELELIKRRSPKNGGL